MEIANNNHAETEKTPGNENEITLNSTENFKDTTTTTTTASTITNDPSLFSKMKESEGEYHNIENSIVSDNEIEKEKKEQAELKNNDKDDDDNNKETNEIDIIKESLKEIADDVNEIVNVTIGDNEDIVKEEEEVILNEITLDNDPIHDFLSQEIQQNDITNSETISKETTENSDSILKETVENSEITSKEAVENSDSILKETVENSEITSKEAVENSDSILKETVENSESIENLETNVEEINVVQPPADKENNIIEENDNSNDNSSSSSSSSDDNDSDSSSDSNSSSDSSSDFDTDSSDDDSDSSSDEEDILTKAMVEKHKKTLDKFNEDMDEDNEENTINLIHSTHEIISLPKVQPITIDIPKDLPITKIGVIQNIVDEYVLVQASISGNYQVLDEDSILLFSDRTPAGRIFETLGPVSLPIYSIRFNNPGEIDKEKYKIGTDIFFNPDLAKLSYTQQIKLIKGSDASNQYDEEPGEDEIEFSDDEKEIEYKRNLKNKRKEKGNERKRQKLNNSHDYMPPPPLPNDIEYEPLTRGMLPPTKHYYSGPGQGPTKYPPMRKSKPSYKPYPNKDGYGRGGRRHNGYYHHGMGPGGSVPPFVSIPPNYGNIPYPPNRNVEGPIGHSSASSTTLPDYDYYGGNEAFDFNAHLYPNLGRRMPPPPEAGGPSLMIDYGSSENDPVHSTTTTSTPAATTSSISKTTPSSTNTNTETSTTSTTPESKN